MWLKLLKPGNYAYAIPQNLANYRLVSKSLSSNKWQTIGYNWKLLRQVEGLPFFKAAYHFMAYAFIGIKKYYIK